MGVTVICNSQTDVTCLVDAACNNDCAALNACGFIL
jgi:hypothetical protein